ncbi:hypothetical protein NDU88_005698 [Pleurodeles waltl]|uniref:Uncharacterized protein n=1 Tax=Pleurodeles waltl TaxID=8319 RepID=A0AAV7SML8_PLEWA|nr:hypothetical protein NDU88_005698 [Pleurodeles waltl]
MEVRAWTQQDGWDQVVRRRRQAAIVPRWPSLPSCGAALTVASFRSPSVKAEARYGVRASEAHGEEFAAAAVPPQLSRAHYRAELPF